MTTPLGPKRFYAEVGVSAEEGTYRVKLDGRTVRTPGRAILSVPTKPLAEDVAAEWRAQGEHIDPAAMPITRLVNTALDGVARERAAVAAEIARYAGTDLLCYRADAPQELVARQAEAWDPLLAWARDALSVDLVVTTGIIAVEQDAEALARVQSVIEAHGDIALTALNMLTTITGSAVLALAVSHRRLPAEEAFELSRLDEAYQAELWGEDAEAAQRTARLKDEALTAGTVLERLG